MAKPPRTPGFDRSSDTFKQSRSIISGKDESSDSPAAVVGADSNTHEAPMGHLEEIRIKPAANGITVSHTVKAPKAPGSGESPMHNPDATKENVFSGPDCVSQAHSHIGNLMSHKAGSGGGLN